MKRERLQDILNRFSSRRIAVIGDFFLDKYLEFDPAIDDISIETGKTAHQVVRVRHSPGAAGNVVKNLISLGAGQVIPIGFTGDDGEGFELRKDLKALGCHDDRMLLEPKRHTPTYLKPQNILVAGIAGELDRFDTKNRQALPSTVEKGIINCLRDTIVKVDAVIIADQIESDEEDLGVITRAVRAALETQAKENPNVVFWVDSRRRMGKFTGMILKPNKEEAVRAIMPEYLGEIEDDLTLKAGFALHKKSGKPIFLTRSEHGMFVFDDQGVCPVPGVKVEGPIDPTGAGDSATAGAVLSLASGAANSEAALVANLVGSITVKCLGETGSASQEQVLARLPLWLDCNKG